MNDKTKEKAFNKIWAIREVTLMSLKEKNPYWKVDVDTAKKFSLSDNEDSKIWDYILSLIEKDRN
jgi:hypothetical protein